MIFLYAANNLEGKINAHMSHSVKNNAIFSITVNQPCISVNIW